jgi:hypothetical protein
VTVPTAIGWAVIGIPDSRRRDPSGDDGVRTPGLLLPCLSVTTALGRGVALLVFL